jgi:hypothetical protein
MGSKLEFPILDPSAPLCGIPRILGRRAASGCGMNEVMTEKKRQHFVDEMTTSGQHIFLEHPGPCPKGAAQTFEGFR